MHITQYDMQTISSTCMTRIFGYIFFVFLTIYAPKQCKCDYVKQTKSYKRKSGQICSVLDYFIIMSIARATIAESHLLNHQNATLVSAAVPMTAFPLYPLQFTFLSYSFPQFF